jgi:hypothetical protein
VLRGPSGTVVAILISAALLPSGCVLGSRMGLRPEKNGQAVYVEACASCHGVGGKGDGPASVALRRRPADLTRLAEQNGGTFPRQHVLDVVTGDERIDAHGDREMPIWNQRFSPTSDSGAATGSIYMHRHLERILAHLESIQQGARH